MSGAHDRLFKAVFQDPKYTAQHLAVSLPPAVLAQLDLSTLTLQKGSFVDPRLAERHSDLLFTVRLRGGGEALLYLLFEHQSTPDPRMPFRLLTYSVRIWEDWLRRYPRSRSLPPVLPLVLYHGQRRWTAPLDLAGMFRLPEAARADLLPLLPRLPYQLLDLSAVPDEELKEGALVALVKLLFKHARDPDLLWRMAGWGEVFRRAHQEGGLRALELVLRYTLDTNSTPHGEQILIPLLLDSAEPGSEEILMTIAQQLRSEGRSEGLSEGLSVGRSEEREHQRKLQAQVLLRLIERLFGAPPPQLRERVLSADHEALVALTDRALSTQSIDALL